jgi:hypothetical protein
MIEVFADQQQRIEKYTAGSGPYHSFKSPAIAAAIARYSLLRHGAAICVHVQFSRYIPL